jgi:hypothetical protein
MTLIVPKGVETPKTSNELEINEDKKAEMVAKAKELMGNKAIGPKDLMNLVEQDYVKSNVHYTSKQLKSIVDQVKIDLAPEETEEKKETIQ